MGYGHTKSKHESLVRRGGEKPIRVSKKLKNLLKEYDPLGLQEFVK